MSGKEWSNERLGVVREVSECGKKSLREPEVVIEVSMSEKARWVR